MSDITSILTIMSPGGLVCGTLINLRGAVMEFEINASLPRGFEADWRMELRGTVECARGQLRVDETKPGRDGMPRYVATITKVRDTDRALFDAWRSKSNLGATPLRVEDPLAVTPRMATSKETEWALRRMDTRRTTLNAASLLRTPAWATPAVAPPPMATPQPTPTHEGDLAPVMQARAPFSIRETPAAPTYTPAAPPAPVRTPMVTRAPAAPAARPAEAPTHPGTVHRAVERVLSDVAPDIGLRRRTLPHLETAAPRAVVFTVENTPGAPIRFSAVYQSPLRYRTDFREQMQWGGLLIELPLAGPVGAEVELRLVTPDGREAVLAASILTSSVRSTCIALDITEDETRRLQP